MPTTSRPLSPERGEQEAPGPRNASPGKEIPSIDRRMAVSLMMGTMLLTLPAHPTIAAEAKLSVAEAFRQSMELELAQNFSQAIEVLTPTQQRFPKNYYVNLRLGWLYYLNGDMANSQRCYQSATRIEPRSVEAKTGLLLPLLAQQRYSEAESMAKMAIRLDANNYFANLRLAFALRMQGKFQVAHEVNQQMLRLYPADVAFLLEQGLTQSALGRSEESRELFQRVLLLQPDNLTASNALAAM